MLNWNHIIAVFLSCECDDWTNAFHNIETIMEFDALLVTNSSVFRLRTMDNIVTRLVAEAEMGPVSFKVDPLMVAYADGGIIYR